MMKWTNLLCDTRLGNEGKASPSKEQRQIRSQFEIDFDRIIFSYPFRRMQDKTQVVPLPEHDFVHTRLTHSLEVSSVGRSLGKIIGAHIIQKHPELTEEGFSAADVGNIVAAASLMHDIGNPPFGHSGERALSSYFQEIDLSFATNEMKQDLLSFEGNAQGFRLVCDENAKDLKLTYATMGAFMKYPCESIVLDKDKSRKSQKKYGFYQSEKETFLKIAETLGLKKQSSTNVSYTRHPLAFLVEAADDICYLIIDMEDAVRMHRISIEKYIELIAPILGNRLNAEKLEQMEDRNQKIGVLRAMTINQLIDECCNVFIANEDAILNGQFDVALSSLIPSAEYIKVIEKFSAKHIYNATEVLEIQAAGLEVLPGLTKYFIDAVEDFVTNGKNCKAIHENAIKLIPSIYFNPEKIDENPYLRFRKIIDFISGMTDTYAVNFYRKIKGMRH